MKDDVPEPVKKRRLHELVSSFYSTAAIRNQRFIGTHQLVLVEGVREREKESWGVERREKERWRGGMWERGGEVEVGGGGYVGERRDWGEERGVCVGENCLVSVVFSYN